MLSETRNSAREMGQHQMDRIHHVADRYLHSAEAVVDEHPLSTTLGVFGIGLCLGVAIGAALSRPQFAHRQAAESLGRRVLDALHDHMPKAVDQYLRA